MTEYFNLSEWLRFHKMLNYRPNAAFEPKRSTVIKNKQRRKREGGKK